jgi:nickel-dependent lactate racemase
MYFPLPPQWSVSQFIENKEDAPTTSVAELTREALTNPLGTPPLENMISGARRIAIIVDDRTRPTPVADILQVLLPYLSRHGAAREKVSIVIALGTHVPMTGEELESRLGKEVVSSYKIVQHDAWQPDLVPVAIAESGRVVKINPEVARADLKIGISSILPHPMAGFGGGPKILMPGVSNFEFVRDHHMRHTIHPRFMAGVTKGNPFHENCLKAAQAIGLDYSINCVYNQHGEIVRIIGGGLESAFEGAVEECYKTLGVRFEEKVDITITSTYPHIHGHQFCKGLNAPDLITREDGAVLMVVPAGDPISGEFVNSFNLVRERSHDNVAEYVKENMSKGEPFLSDKPVEFNMAMTCVILRPKIRTVLVSPSVSQEAARTMGFDYAPTVEEGVKLLERDYAEARVAIFPTGGLIIPLTTWS